MSQFKLTVAPNGARKTKADHPAVPMTIAEIAQTAQACWSAGAHALHLHVRDAKGRHSLDPGLYAEAMDAVTELAPGMEIQITTESAGRFGVTEQMACLAALRPTAASIAIREMARDPSMAAQVYALAAESGTQVQHILYTPECFQQLQAWQASGIIHDSRPDVICVLGQYDPPTAAQPADLQGFAKLFARGGIEWTACAFGQNEQACLLHAIAKGSHARLGFENNLHHPDGTLLLDNAQAVANLISAARAAGYTPMEV